MQRLLEGACLQAKERVLDKTNSGTWILYFQPPEPGEDTFLVFRPPSATQAQGSEELTQVSSVHPSNDLRVYGEGGAFLISFCTQGNESPEQLKIKS